MVPVISVLSVLVPSVLLHLPLRTWCRSVQFGPVPVHVRPLRDQSRPSGSRLFRSRSYRSCQFCPVLPGPCLNPARPNLVRLGRHSCAVPSGPGPGQGPGSIPVLFPSGSVPIPSCLDIRSCPGRVTVSPSDILLRKRTRQDKDQDGTGTGRNGDGTGTGIKSRPRSGPDPGETGYH